MESYKVMFVCLGNICRSPLANTVLQNLVDKAHLEDRILVESSGTGAWHVGEKADSRMRQTAQSKGLTITHLARRFSPQDFYDFNLILAMDHHNYQDIIPQAAQKELAQKVCHFRDFDPEGSGDVPDPWSGGQKGFEEVWTIVERTCTRLFQHIQKKLGS